MKIEYGKDRERMSKGKTIEAQAEELLFPITESCGVEIYELLKQGLNASIENAVIEREGEVR